MNIATIKDIKLVELREVFCKFLIFNTSCHMDFLNNLFPE